MSRRSSTLAAQRAGTTLLAAWLAIGAVAAAPAVPDGVKQNVRQRVDAGFTPGIVIGLVDADGTTYWSYGATSRKAGAVPDENTVFEIGSITKAFTGTLLAHFALRGDVGLEDPVTSYLPEGTRVNRKGDEPIRLLHLATHRSGMPRMPFNFKPADPSNPFADYTLDRLYEFLGGYEPARGVGADYEYSNVGVGLLGHLLERRSGNSYEALVREVITGPLGMSSTGITLTPRMESRAASGYAAGTVPMPLWDLPTLAGAGALRSTASDMLVWLAANMGLRETSLRPAMRLAQQPRAEAGSSKMKVGLGWHILADHEPAIVWHNGGTGGQHAFAGFLADGSLGVVVLGNSNDSIDDIGIHLLDASQPLAERERPKRPPLFKKD